MPTLTVRSERWPLRKVFAISRGPRTAADVVVVQITDGEHRGRGECTPYPRYGESVDSVVQQIVALEDAIRGGLGRDELQRQLPPGAARNAVDCALWDLDAKRTETPAWRLAGSDPPGPIVSAFTISLDDPAATEETARAEAHRPWLKVKLSGSDDVARVAAVRRAAPGVRLLVDANEAWTAETFQEWSPALAALGVELIEQPLPASADGALATLPHPIPVAADESCHTSEDVAKMADRYDVVNLKLDKAGGLTEAFRFRDAARRSGLQLMVGCMIGTSLGVAPALLVACGARYVDLDAPLWLAEDRPAGLQFAGSVVSPASRELWG